MKADSIEKLLQLARDPSPESWRLLCEALAEMPIEHATPAIDQLEPLLASWDDKLRATMCGMSWDDAFFAGNPDPRSSIVKHLRFDRIFFGRYGGMRMRSPNLGESHMTAFASSPGARNLTRIDFSFHPLRGAGARALARGRHFASLRELKLSSCEIDADGVVALANAAFYPQLEHINLGSNRLEGEAIAPLVAASSSGELSLLRLVLGSNPLGESGAAVLARARVASLREIDITECELGVEGARALARRASESPVLDCLHVSDNHLGDDGLVALASGSLSARSLIVSNDSIGIKGLTALLRANWPLRSLTLSNNAIGDDAVRALVELGSETLEELRIDDNDVTGVGLAALLSSDRIGLKTLNATGNRVGAEALRHLGRTLRTVVSLSLGENRVGDEGIGYLAGAQAHELKSLSLIRNGITARALETLTGAPWFGGLTGLDLSFNPLGAAAGLVLGARPLTSLTLAGCGLGDEGAIALAGAEFRPVTLHLPDCDLTDRGLEALSHSKVLTNVETLSISRNRITDRGVLALTRSKNASRIKELYIEGNRVSDAGAIALSEWAGPLAFYVDNNAIGEKGKEALGKLPQRCCP